MLTQVGINASFMAESDTQSLSITRRHSGAQNKPAWKAKTVIARI